MPGCFTSIRDVATDAKRLLEPVHLFEQGQALLEDVVDATVAREVFLGFQHLLAMAQTQQVTLVNVQMHDLLEQLIQCLFCWV